MWKPWQWSRTSNLAAVGNARVAATELSRCRVERQEVELYLSHHLRPRPVAVVAARAAEVVG